MGSLARRATKWLDPAKIAEHGQYIFIYVSPKYNQVIYSLTRTLKNNRSIRQLPFLGKGTRPNSLRKDAWKPLATVAFPSGLQGLAAYKQLTEFRKRHDHEWKDAEIIEAARHLRREREMDEDEREERRALGEKYYEQEIRRRRLRRPTKTRGKPPMKYLPYWWRPDQLWVQNRRERAQVVMMLQKANSIADLAWVLGHQEEAANDTAEKLDERRAQTAAACEKAEARIREIQSLKAKRLAEGTEASLKEYKELKNEKMRLRRALDQPDPYAALEGFYSWLNDNRKPAKRGPGRVRMLRDTPVISMDGVRVEWADILDAQYARSWPESVVHDVMPQPRRPTAARHVATTVLQPPRAIRLLDAPKSKSSDGESHAVSTVQYSAAVKSRAAAEEPEEESPPPPKSMMERILRRLKYGNN